MNAKQLTPYHISPDDSYVKLQYGNLYSYDAVIAKLPNHPDLSLEKLCKSPVKFFENPWAGFGFHATEYSVDPR
jgi:hypothetical protein